MNLRAKGFFLDNAGDITQLAKREREDYTQRVKEMKKKQSMLLTVISGSDAQKGVEAAEELRELS